MKVKTRLIIAFLLILCIPFALLGVAFLGFTGIQADIIEENYGVPVTLETISDSMQLLGNTTSEIFDELKQQSGENPSVFLDGEYLDEINEALKDKHSYLLVRVDDSLYYNGSGEDASEIFSELPKFRDFVSAQDGGSYLGTWRLFVKQIDVRISDEELEEAGLDAASLTTTGAEHEVSLFIVSSTSQIIHQIKALLRDLSFSIVLILAVTVLGMFFWVYRGINTPLRKLSEATHHIREGDYDFELDVKGNDEISVVCQDFEDMRKRLKALDEEKKLFDRQSKELISNISHDLKTPITAVKGYVEGIMDGVADTPEKMNRYIRTIYNKANDMDRLINELTFYSKIDTNKIPYSFSKIDVTEYFDDCAEEMELDLREKKISFSYINNAAPGTLIIADAEQMKRVVNNIIGNSVKYMDKSKKSIQIRVDAVGDFVRVELEDNGKGIPNKDLPLIFDRFYRTDLSRNSAQGGSGIGLSIVKKIIEDHGGRIWATSKVGEGTVMHIELRKYQERPLE